MIAGIGTDIVRIERLEQSLQRHGERFAQKILGEGEWQEFQQCGEKSRPHFLAKRFAAKEAAAKALGTGFRDGIQLHHIEVTHTAQGKPELRFSAAAERQLQQLGVRSTHLSISDEQEHAVAFVILEK